MRYMEADSVADSMTSSTSSIQYRNGTPPSSPEIKLRARDPGASSVPDDSAWRRPDRGTPLSDYSSPRSPKSPPGWLSSSFPPTPPSVLPSSRAGGCVEFGATGTLRHRLLFLGVGGSEVSHWHSVPLFGQGLGTRAIGQAVNMVCTTPRGTWAEFEYAREEPFTPLELHQEPRSVPPGFETTSRPSAPVACPARFAENIPFNCGLLPQTWMDPQLQNAEYGGLLNDDLPLEVIEIGEKQRRTGEVYPVKVLTAFALVDALIGLLSWKVLVVDCGDPLARVVDDVADLHEVAPGLLEDCKEWLQRRRCHAPNSRPAVYGMNERPLPHSEAALLAASAHASWRKLIIREPMETPSSEPGGEPMAVFEYETIWERYTARESNLFIPLSDPSVPHITSLHHALPPRSHRKPRPKLRSEQELWTMFAGDSESEASEEVRERSGGSGSLPPIPGMLHRLRSATSPRRDNRVGVTGMAPRSPQPPSPISPTAQSPFRRSRSSTAFVSDAILMPMRKAEGRAYVHPRSSIVSLKSDLPPLRDHRESPLVAEEGGKGRGVEDVLRQLAGRAAEKWGGQDDRRFTRVNTGRGTGQGEVRQFEMRGEGLGVKEGNGDGGRGQRWGGEGEVFGEKEGREKGIPEASEYWGREEKEVQRLRRAITGGMGGGGGEDSEWRMVGDRGGTNEDEEEVWSADGEVERADTGGSLERYRQGVGREWKSVDFDDVRGGSQEGLRGARAAIRDSRAEAGGDIGFRDFEDNGREGEGEMRVLQGTNTGEWGEGGRGDEAGQRLGRDGRGFEEARVGDQDSERLQQASTGERWDAMVGGLKELRAEVRRLQRVNTGKRRGRGGEEVGQERRAGVGGSPLRRSHTGEKVRSIAEDGLRRGDRDLRRWERTMRRRGEEEDIEQEEFEESGSFRSIPSWGPDEKAMEGRSEVTRLVSPGSRVGGRGWLGSMGEEKKGSNGSPGPGPGPGVGVWVGMGGKGRKLLTREDFLVTKSGAIGRRAEGNEKEDRPCVSLQRDTSEEGFRSTPMVSPMHMGFFLPAVGGDTPSPKRGEAILWRGWEHSVRGKGQPDCDWLGDSRRLGEKDVTSSASASQIVSECLDLSRRG